MKVRLTSVANIIALHFVDCGFPWRGHTKRRSSLLDHQMAIRVKTSGQGNATETSPIVVQRSWRHVTSN